MVNLSKGKISSFQEISNITIRNKKKTYAEQTISDRIQKGHRNYKGSTIEWWLVEKIDQWTPRAKTRRGNQNHLRAK